VLFTLHNSVSAIVASRGESAAVQSVLSQLLISHAHGRHVLLLNRATASSIEQNPSFSAPERSTARSIGKRFTELGHLVSRLKTYVEICCEGSFPTLDGTRWIVPLAWLDGIILDSTFLVTEDLNDFNVLVVAARAYLASKNLNGFVLQLRPAPGGGSNTWRILQHAAVEARNPTICVVDSDRDYPGAPVGHTANACLKLNGSGLFQVRVTEGRSLENSIPWSLIDRVRTSKLGSQPLKTLTTVEPECAKYLDLKNGMDGRTILGRPYWERIARTLVGECCCEKACQLDKWKKCPYILYEGLRPSFLSDLHEDLQEHRYKNPFNFHEEDDWSEIARLVFEYGLGGKRQRI
jgi:hypothetical protein